MFFLAHTRTLHRASRDRYGPNFPGHNGPPGPAPATCTNLTPVAGDALDLKPNQGSMGGTHICQDVHSTALDQIVFDVAPTLCVQPAGPGSPTDGATLELATCASVKTAAQGWNLPAHDIKPEHVVHVSSGLCLTAGGASGRPTKVTLAKCATLEGDAQMWVLGASGRLCTSDQCLSVADKKTGSSGGVASRGPSVVRASFV